MVEDTQPITFEHRGQTYTLSKRRRHQWWTDIVLSSKHGEALIGREEAPLTRGEAKRLAHEWLERHASKRASAPQ